MYIYVGKYIMYIYILGSPSIASIDDNSSLVNGPSQRVSVPSSGGTCQSKSSSSPDAMARLTSDQNSVICGLKQLPISLLEVYLRY